MPPEFVTKISREVRVRTLVGAARARRALGYPIANTANGRFLFDPDDIYIASHFKLGHVFEQKYINGILRPIIARAKVIADVGANIGSHTISYLKLNPDCRVHAFEPQSSLYAILRRNIKLNDLSDRVELSNYALAHVESESSLRNLNSVYSPDYHGFNKGGIGLGFGGEKVKVKTLDSLNLTGLDLLKLDVEGAEGLVMLGAAKTIRKFKPAIFFESNSQSIDPKLFGMESIPSPFDLLKSLGYQEVAPLGDDNYLAQNL